VGELAEPRELQSGTMLDDKYRIDELLAVGGMGAVYVGTHTKLRKRVAIKVLNPGLSSPPMIERFHREAITASQIGHEGIAQVTDIGTSKDGEPFLVMELLEGESLARRMKSSGALPIEVACELGCSILSPLGAAHRAGIIHRDLKPDNVFLVRQSRGEMVKLLDFGISRAQGLEQEFRLTTTGLVLGTPYYMSPEQARGEHVITPLTDLYSLGVMLYEMLIGAVPISGENYNQLMYRVMTGEFVTPRQIRGEIPEALEQLIIHAMASDPTHRPRSAEEFEQSLLMFCRPTYREHQIERISSQGFAPALTPAPMTKSQSNIQYAGTAPNTPVPTPMQNAPGKKSRKGLIVGIIAMLAVGGGIAAAVIASSSPTIDPVVAPPTPVTMTPAPPPTPTPAKPVEPAAPTQVTLKFAVTPANAVIEVDGKKVDGDLTVDKDTTMHKLHVSAAGYGAHDEDIHFDMTQRLTVDLAKQATVAPVGAKQPKAPATTKKPPDKIENQSPY
jgi:eukaryotic-like serine/threonine-protein kinase